MKLAYILPLFALAACNPIGSDMPDLNNAQSLRAALLKLDPIAPGGKPDPTGMYNLGQPGSDRDLFFRWVENHASEDEWRQRNIDYKPAPLPATIQQAIAEQREVDHRQTERLKAEQVAGERQEAARLAAAQAETAARQQRQAVQRQAEEAYGQRYEQRIQAYEECNRLRDLPESPENHGIYPAKTCEQKRDEEDEADRATNPTPPM